MSSVFPPPRRTITLKADRETLVLLAAVAALTFAIGHSAKSRPTALIQASNEQAASAGEWAGRLTEPPPQSQAAAPPDALSSAALTVPKAAMALPNAPRPAVTAPARPHACDAAPCPQTKTAATAPARRFATRRPLQEASLVDRLNPLNHLPASVKQPFSSAGDAIAGWWKRL